MQQSEQDFFLSQILKLVYDVHINIDLTILVDGFVITGTAVSPEEYLSWYVGAWRLGLQKSGADLPIDLEGLELDADFTGRFADHLFLKDASVISPSERTLFSALDEYPPYWSVRLGKISSWTFGRFGMLVD